MDRGKLSLLSCKSGGDFYKKVVIELRKIAKHSIDTPNMLEEYFPNGEVKIEILNNIRGNDIYIFQNIDDPNSDRNINDNFFAILNTIDAVRFADADSITAVLPQYPYARQERRKEREGITAKLVARQLEEVGVDRVITLDLHAASVQGFFPTAKLENLHASGIFIDHFKDLESKNIINKDNTVVVAPDMGSTERARYYSNQLGYDIAVIDKARNYSKASTIKSMKLLGDVKDKNLIIIDDMISTGGTLLRAISTLKEFGAKDIYIATSLPFFNGDAIKNFSNAYKEGKFKSIIGTDAVFWGEKFINEHEWYDEISIAPLFAEVIYRINHKQSVSELLNYKKRG